jgi:hypothetical protein
MLGDSNRLDGKYTAFGRLVPGIPNALNHVASLTTDAANRPLDILEATIKTAKILDPYVSSGLMPPDRDQSNIKTELRKTGEFDVYNNSLHNVKFDIPYRWAITEAGGKQFGVIIEPTELEHNVKSQIEKSGFIPKVIVTAEPRHPDEGSGVSTAFFSVKGADDPKISSNYVCLRVTTEEKPIL